VAVQHCDVALALREALGNRDTPFVDLGLLLDPDQDLVRGTKRGRVGWRLVDEHLSLEPVAHVARSGGRGVAQPHVDFADRLPVAPSAGLQARLLEGLLDLLLCGVAVSLRVLALWRRRSRSKVRRGKTKEPQVLGTVRQWCVCVATSRDCSCA